MTTMWGVLMMEWCEKQAILMQFRGACKDFALMRDYCRFGRALPVCIPGAVAGVTRGAAAVFHAGEQQLTAEVE
ncbi:MAG: hypothetical protein HYS20_02485 [Rhodocyclales bacterium]|nr:hypothetical protein [Rhodocyclales bacterium]